MRIYLIRHGRQESPLCNVNVSLSPEGREQARLLGKRLLEENIGEIWSSDLLRAMETAEILNESLRVPRVIRTGLREISFGDLEGLSDEVIAERYELFLRERAKMDRDLSYPGGECAADVVRRAGPGMEGMLEGPYEAVAVVTHGGVIRSLTAHYLGMDLAKTQLLAGHLENCGITEFVFRGFDGRFFLNRFNDYAHLEAYPKLLRKGGSGKR